MSGPRFRDHNELTGEGINGIISYWPASQKTRWHDARICLGETQTDALNRFDLCYSFKVLCQAEYGGTRQLHHAAKNYARNYGLSAGLHQNRRIPYERALRNLVVLMFSHYVNHLECTGSLEGHRTLMVHECLVVAAALGRYHRWQRRVSHQDRDTYDWTKVPVVPKDDFWHKYSPALALLGNEQNPAYAHPKLLGRCFNNVYFCGRIIGDLPARGRAPHSEERTKLIYDQEYEELVHWLENTLDLTLESPSYSMVPTSLVNPDIVLPHQEFRKRRGLPELPSGRGPEQREYTMDGVRGLIDLDWSQRTPIFHPDDIDRDPQFNQYPYPEDDLDYDEEEEMETDYQNAPLGGAGDAHMAPPANARHRCYRPPATYSKQSTQSQTVGSPRSTHTDTDTAMEMGGLSMAPGGPDTHRVPPRAKAPTAPGSMSTPELAATVARGVAAAATEILEWYARPPDEAERPPVDQAADAALRECLQRHLKASPWTTPGSQPVSERVSVFDRLGHRVQDTQKEDEWTPHPEMTPRKVEHGRQPGRDQDSSSRPPSQKRRSQSRPRDEANAKKGRMDSEHRPSKIQVGIDWANTGIGKPVPKPDSKHPSFKADPSGVDEPQPRMKSTITKPKQSSETQDKDSVRKKEDSEKKVLQDKPHRWIEARVKRLDPGGYPEEVQSLRYFGRNACDFAMGIIAIADWGRRYLDKGLRYPIPTFPPYLFTPLPESCQSGAQVPVKPSQLGGPGGDVRHRCRESWKWLVMVLQFWTDEETVANGAVYRGRVRPASALAEYMMNTVNPGLEPGSKVSWEDVITRTPWMSKRLHGMTAGQEQTVRRQALPISSESSELEVLSKKLHAEYLSKMPSAGQGKSPLGRAGTLRLHLKKVEKGWTQANQSGTGPGVGNPNQYPKEAPSQSKQEELNQPSRSPLTNELLDPGEELLGELDYEDVEETNPGPDPEIAQAVAHIPQVDACADVKMQEVRPPLGFEPEVVKAGYDVNLVRSDQTEPGSSSPVMVGEDRMLDVEESQPRAPGNGRPGSQSRPDR